MTEYQLFREITVAVCGTLDLSLGLSKALSILTEVLPVDELRLNVLDVELHAVKTVATADYRGGHDMLEAPLVMPIPPAVEAELRGTSLPDVRIVDRTGDDRATESVRSDFFPHVPESSLLIQRLLLDGRRQGVLIFRAEGEGRYREEHKRLVAGLNEPFAIALNNALAHHELEKLRDRLREHNRYLAAEAKPRGAEIVGASFGLSHVMKLVESVAALDSPVLVLGETGVGKEVIADAVHGASPRRDGPFVKLNCGAIPETLVDSELFGHEKGAFTGAVAQKKGRFEIADGGTLFLDEIGELPPDVQVRLLRVLQSGSFQRVGGHADVTVDVRVIAATHRDLGQLVADGRFREDLWYRINVFPIRVPPLRERRADIPALVHHFVEKKSLEMGLPARPRLAEGDMQLLRDYRWPGNVRELENAVERAIILSGGDTLKFQWLGGDTVPGPPAAGEPGPIEALDHAVAAHIRQALRQAGGRVEGPGGAAELLKVNPSTLRHRMRRLGIRFGRGQS